LVDLVCVPSGPFCPATLMTSFSFEGVGFQLLLSSPEPGSGIAFLQGQIVERMGLSYRLTLLGDPLLGRSSVNWTSPDNAVLVVWQAPFLTIESDGSFDSTVTFGVSYEYLGGL